MMVFPRAFIFMNLLSLQR